MGWEGKGREGKGREGKGSQASFLMVQLPRQRAVSAGYRVLIVVSPERPGGDVLGGLMKHTHVPRSLPAQETAFPSDLEALRTRGGRAKCCDLLDASSNSNSTASLFSHLIHKAWVVSITLFSGNSLR